MKFFYKYKNHFIILILFISCKENTNQEKIFKEKIIDKNIIEKSKIINNKKSLSKKDFELNLVNQFSTDENEIDFFANDFELNYSMENNCFQINKNKNFIKKIDFENKPFEGVGYNIFLYQSKISTSCVIVFEALADIGTSWYYFVLINKNLVVKSFFIYEPRANSNLIILNDFLKINIKNDDCILKFKKRYVATYSNIPINFKSDHKYVYIYK